MEYELPKGSAVSPFVIILGAGFFLLSALLVWNTGAVMLIGPKEVPQQMVLLDSVLISMARVLVGSAFSFVLASTVATASFYAIRPLCHTIMLVAMILAITPPPVWSSLVVLTVGLRESAPVITIILSTVFVLTTVNIYLLRHIPARRFHIAATYELSLMRQLRYVVYPEVRHGLLLGMRLTAVISWIALITAESINASSGLGGLVLFGRSLFDWQIVLSGWVAIIGCALLTDTVIVLIGRAVTAEESKANTVVAA